MIMRKIIVAIILLIIAISSLSAQNTIETEGMHEHDVSNVLIQGNMYDWRLFDNKMGLTVYGSRYRKANEKIAWGRVLCFVITPACLLGTVDGFAEGRIAQGIAFIIPTGAALGLGIPLWIKGQKDKDAMADDYSKQYAPKSRAALNVGATPNGIGVAFSF